jgi:hypothetical protein
MSTENNSSNDPEGTIPVGQAAQMTANWRNYIETSGQEFAINAFLIPIINLQNILKYNPDAEGVRAYLGLIDATDPSTVQLVLVPVVDGNDVPYLPLQNGADGILQGGGGSNTYDYTKTCPPVCSKERTLNS